MTSPKSAAVYSPHESDIDSEDSFCADTSHNISCASIESNEVSASQSILDEDIYSSQCSKCLKHSDSLIICVYCGTSTCCPCTSMPISVEDEAETCRIVNTMCQYDAIIQLCGSCRLILEDRHEKKTIIDRHALQLKVDTIQKLEKELSELKLVLQGHDHKHTVESGTLLPADSLGNRKINPKEYNKLKQKTTSTLNENASLHTKISNLQETNETQAVEIERLSK